jgi:hypothetical protein
VLDGGLGCCLIAFLDVLLGQHVLDRGDALQGGFLSASQVQKRDHLVCGVWLLGVCDSSEDVQKVEIDCLNFSWVYFGGGQKFVLFADGAAFGEVRGGERRHGIIIFAKYVLKV